MTEPPPNLPRTPQRGFALSPALPAVSAARTPRTPSFSKKGQGEGNRRGNVTPIGDPPGSGRFGGFAPQKSHPRHAVNPNPLPRREGVRRGFASLCQSNGRK